MVENLRVSVKKPKKPLFDDDLSPLVEENKTLFPVKAEVKPKLDVIECYVNDFNYLLSKIKENRIISKPKDLEFIEKSLKLMDNSEGFSIKKINIKNLCNDGIPDICRRVRPLFWRILLGYFPEEKVLWFKCIEEHRKKYEDYVNTYLLGKKSSDPSIKDNIQETKKGVEFLKCYDHPLSKAKNSTWNSFFADQSLWDEIEKDILRTRKELGLYNIDSEKKNGEKYPSLSKQKKVEGHYEILTRILFIYAKKNPDIGYVQGMNEILAPIYYCFLNDDKDDFFATSLEVDSFFCFSIFMQEINSNFITVAELNKLGVELRIRSFNELLKRMDTRLYDHFKKININVHLFAFQWLLLFLSQEFAIDDVLKLWDCLFCQKNRKEYLDFMCLAILHILREELLKEEYGQIILMLQNIKELDVRIIQEKARSLYNEYLAYVEENNYK